MSWRVVAAAFALTWLCAAPTASADIVRGLGSILAGLIEIPRSMLVGTFSGPPILGTIVGALSGAVNGLSMVAGGTLELVGSAIPIARSVAPILLPIFL